MVALLQERTQGWRKTILVIFTSLSQRIIICIPNILSLPSFEIKKNLSEYQDLSKVNIDHVF